MYMLTDEVYEKIVDFREGYTMIILAPWEIQDLMDEFEEPRDD